MNSNFDKLPEEKKKNIINAAIEEFGRNSFDTASTDAIVEKAGIAKGSLFYYFGSKKNLYIHIVKYCIDLLTKVVMDDIENISEDDFFERIKLMSFAKQQLYFNYPLHSQIIIKAFVNTPQKLKDDLGKIYTEYYASGLKLIKDYLMKYIKPELFKDGVNEQEVFFITMSVLEGLSNKYLKIYKDGFDVLMKNIEGINEEYNRYIELIKYGIYKEKRTK